MSEFKPTNELRFVNRTVENIESGGYYPTFTTYKILQQKWIKNVVLFLGGTIANSYEEEWRDVPLEEEV